MISFNHIKPLIQTSSSPLSRLFSYIGLGIGVLLLLCSIQMYINIQQLLGDEAPQQHAYDYIPIRKDITNETMGQLDKNMFSQKDVDDLKAQPFVDGVSPLLANDFRVQISGGRLVPFVSDFFIEALDNKFIDTVPPNFSWQVGQEELPIIVASDFLELYNVFAPGYGLAQLSEETATSVGLQVICYAPDGSKQVFKGRIVALSDRVNSFLVPATFMQWANKEFSTEKELRASRLYIKIKDANNPAFLTYLEQKGYEVNKDRTRFGRVKGILQGIFSGLGVFGLLVVALALLLFSFYLQLMIARSKDNLQLLLLLGYSPGWLSSKVSQRFVPVYISIILIALLFTQLMQYAFHQYVMNGRTELSSMVHWSVIVAAVVLILLSIFTNYRMVKNLLFKL